MQQPQQSVNVVNVPGQPTNVQYIVAAPPTLPRPAVYAHFPEKPAVSVGVTLIIAGILSIIFNIVEVAVGVKTPGYPYNYYSSWLFGYVGHGFWVGIMCIIPGGIGIGAGVHKTRSRICGFNVMCVLAASFSAAQFCIGLTGAIIGPLCYNYNYYYAYGSGPCGNESVAIGMEALLTVLAAVEAFSAIYGSALCCRTYCCCSCCETKPESVMRNYGTPVAIISDNQHQSTSQYPVAIQSYQNVMYQPNYPNQPVQFASIPSAYTVQGRYTAAEQPPNYPGMSGQGVQLGNCAMYGGIEAFSTDGGQPQTTFTTTQQQSAYISTPMITAK